MILWDILIALSVIFTVLSLCGITRHLYGILKDTALAKRRPFALAAACAICVLCAAALSLTLLGAVNTAVVILHFGAFLLAAACLVHHFFKKGNKRTANVAALCLALLCTVGYLGAAYRNSAEIRKTEYTVFTEKAVPKLRIALFADAHIGATLDDEKFSAIVEKINAQQPDIVLIAGDFIDENTAVEEVTAACAALRGFTAPLGVYYVFGNHDTGFFEKEKQREKVQLLRKGLQKSGVRILEDAGYALENGYYLLGRADAGSEENDAPRADAKTLLEKAPPECYTILLDHQPTDYKKEAEAGADLVLSGHTHGGQLLPLQLGMRLLHAGGVDLVYGMKTLGNTAFCVTSGLSSWGIRFKSGCFSEYVILTIEPQKKRHPASGQAMPDKQPRPRTRHDVSARAIF